MVASNEFLLFYLMDSDLAQVNGKSAR